MARKPNRLKDKQVRSSNLKPGYHGDGGGLWLQVSPSGSKSWVFRYSRSGKTHDLGLGSFLNVSLAAARDKATNLRQALGRGEDPLALRHAAKAAVNSRMTFEQCANAYIEANQAGWKNRAHIAQWKSTLKTYAFPVIGRLDVSHVDTGHVLRILEPIWLTKTETATRLRGRIELILAWATTRKLRSGDNPAAWRNHLQTILPKPTKVAKTSNHPALPYAELPGFIAKLRSQPGSAARALEFAILTATRTGEVIGAQWGEIDFDKAVWTIPAERMKAGKEHRIPLSARAVAVLREVEALRESDFVFPGWKAKTGLSNMAMLKLMHRMQEAEASAGRKGLIDPASGKTATPHGFRSTFRDWAGETTTHPREVIEHAMAHQLSDKAEAAYARGTLFDKRRALMDDWAVYARPIEVPLIGAE